MAAQVDLPIQLEYLPSSHYETKVATNLDVFRHQSTANSHNHHDAHPWGTEVSTDSSEFDSLYAKANNQFMYHLWYKPELAPYMATELVCIRPISAQVIAELASLYQVVLKSGIDVALNSELGHKVVATFQATLDKSGLRPTDAIFIRLGATSVKDSFAGDMPTIKPSPMYPRGSDVLRRLLTSSRSAGRILSLNDRIWTDDPGEVLVIQKWSPSINVASELRVFCFEGRVTAISQDVWWEPQGWRDRYTDGVAQAICEVWDHVKGMLPFSTCTMDVLMSESSTNSGWTASVIEFNGFGAHLNTGSDLFHWLHDAKVLEGQQPGITLRFVDDWEGNANRKPKTAEPTLAATTEAVEPDWFALEKKLRSNYDRGESVQTGSKLPLRGRWSSAY